MKGLAVIMAFCMLFMSGCGCRNDNGPVVDNNDMNDNVITDNSYENAENKATEKVESTTEAGMGTQSARMLDDAANGVGRAVDDMGNAVENIGNGANNVMHDIGNAMR